MGYMWISGNDIHASLFKCHAPTFVAGTVGHQDGGDWTPTRTWLQLRTAVSSNERPTEIMAQAKYSLAFFFCDAVRLGIDTAFHD